MLFKRATFLNSYWTTELIRFLELDKNFPIRF